MKYTILPPQKTPKLETAHRRPANLGEHKAAFLNANNRLGFQSDEVSEEPVSEELAALFTTTLENAPKLSRAERKRGLSDWHRKLHMAGYRRVDGVYVKTERAFGEPVKQLTPQELYEKSRRDPKWQQPWNYPAYHESMWRKHIVSTRREFEFKAVLDKLLNDEYVTRREALAPSIDKHNDEPKTRLDKLLGKLDQQSHIKNPVLRRLVSLEKADRLLAERQFSVSVEMQEFVDSVLGPKSDPNGHNRINPYLD